MNKIFFVFICAMFFSISAGSAQTMIILPDNLYIKNKSFRYYLNVPTINRPASSSSPFTQAVIVIHGTNRNAEDYFGYIREAAGKSGRASNTLIIAPRFFADDADNLHPSMKEYFHYWGQNSLWKKGGLSAGSKHPISSFEVINQILAKINVNFSKIKEVVVTGHAVGGQFVQSYAALEDKTDKFNFKTSYVLVNASSYMYMNQERYGYTADCPAYNEYHYGLVSLPSHLRRKRVDKDIVHRFVGLSVTLLLGNKDTDDYYLDISCEAQVQGTHRYDRGLKYYDNIKRNYPKHNHHKSLVYDIGHSAKDMYKSRAGVNAVFMRPLK